MDQNHNEPPATLLSQGIAIVDAPGTSSFLETSFENTQRLRHDGWDGEKKATFCQTLAETGVVSDACFAARMSAKSAYALRHRDKLFASAWEAALSMARARLADDLLARSLQGSQELITRDGCIVGERHHFDNKLAFAMLRRLDRRAELGATFRVPPRGEAPLPAPALNGEWQPLLDALSEERADDAARLLAPEPLEGDKGNEGNDPLNSTEDEKPRFDHKRIWRSWSTGKWRTSFPPPADFDGDQDGEWEDPDYWRDLTLGEIRALVAAGIADPEDAEEYRMISIDEDEAERDAFFRSLLDSGPAVPPE